MVLAFPYHDPKGLYNASFRKNIAILKQIFAGIYLGVSPPTADGNAAFINHLSHESFFTYINPRGTTIGDHYRSALKIASQNHKEIIHFSFLDRVLYALESDPQTYKSDIATYPENILLIFSRSPKAWATHPQNYFAAEKFVMEAYENLLHQKIDLNFCAMSVNHHIASQLLQGSISPSFNVAGEWVLTAIQNHIQVKNKNVDWLSWEDPFWQGIDPHILKNKREADPAETLKRRASAQEFLSLIQDNRFRKLFLQ